MRIYIISILSFVLTSCADKNQKLTDQNVLKIENNIELIEIYSNDQSDRKSTDIDWYFVSRRDSLRRDRVNQLLDSGKVVTSEDYQNAAMVFQHGRDSIAYKKAMQLMKKSIELDSTANKWLLAAATDRYYLSIGQPQIYGTQYQKNTGELWRLGDIDTTQISDEERIEFGVETLAEQRIKVEQMNKTQLSELNAQGKSIEEIIHIVKSENLSGSDYDISESAINSFGYNLINLGKKQDALKIFELNIELYPKAFNAYDSYGECLLLLGQKEKGLEAYKTSLKLNPNNINAKKIIKKNNKPL